MWPGQAWLTEIFGTLLASHLIQLCQLFPARCQLSPGMRSHNRCFRSPSQKGRIHPLSKPWLSGLVFRQRWDQINPNVLRPNNCPAVLMIARFVDIFHRHWCWPHVCSMCQLASMHTHSLSVFRKHQLIQPVKHPLKWLKQFLKKTLLPLESSNKNVHSKCHRVSRYTNRFFFALHKSEQKKNYRGEKSLCSRSAASWAGYITWK